jgi:hypothetical protein
VAKELGGLAAIMRADNLGKFLPYPRLMALMKVELGGLPKVACM